MLGASRNPVSLCQLGDLTLDIKKQCDAQATQKEKGAAGFNALT